MAFDLASNMDPRQMQERFDSRPSWDQQWSGFTSWLNDAGRNLGNAWNNISGTTAQMEFNSAESVKQREWEKMMSDTSYQRQVADMKAAGINPVAASMGGNMSGASTPSGSAASSGMSGNGGFAGGLGQLIKTVAGVAIAKGLEAKFTRSAMQAADNHELVGAKIRSLAAEERANTARAAELEKRNAPLRGRPLFDL